MTPFKWLNWAVLILLAAVAVAGPVMLPLGKDFNLAYLVPLFWWVLGCGWRQPR